MSKKPTAPIGTTSLGSDGERRSSEANEFLPHGKANTRSPSQHVSRETSELTDAQAMLDEIMDCSMPKASVPLEGSTEENDANPEAHIVSPQDSSPEISGVETPPPTPPRKNRSASVFTYLAVLFGAAFLMLLLAYFVQQRNNAAVLDDLRMTTAASKEELVESIKTLEEENSTLKAEQEKISADLTREKQNLNQQAELYRNQAERLTDFTRRTTLDNGLNHLERFIGARDWLMAGVLVEMLDGSYNEHNPNYTDRGLLPSQKARYLELRETVFDKGKCMVIEGTATEDPNEYTEYPHIWQDIFDEQDLKAARSLASILSYYPTSLDIVSNFLCLSQINNVSLERLNSGAFKPSTVALYEQVKADMIAAGALKEENGKLIAGSEIPTIIPESAILE